ncbi:MAG: F0F1 ATP synthase subunit delta [Defluviitaleaceae bacterium]|nr:F0F1 ATP synthase subunit delta [Defluviitaleaceae bacterium]
MAKLKLTDQYAYFLLKTAHEQNRLEEIYKHAISQAEPGREAESGKLPDLLEQFLGFVPQIYLRPVLVKFVRLARKRLGIMDVNVISAAPLSSSQLVAVEKKIREIFGDRINLVTGVDATLLGGLRVVAGHSVVDNTIKKRLAEMKKNVYRGVYFKNAD